MRVQDVRVLELKDVTLLIGDEADQKALLHEATLRFSGPHFCAIVGPSGCGKSTLLKIIAGLHEPTTGSVHWEDRDLSTEGDLAPSEIGYVPQFSIAFDHLDVWENVETAMRLRVRGLDAEQRSERTEHILHEVGLDGIMDRPVGVLSGGQKRRLSLALEMVTSPALMLADEVTSGLDPKAEKEITALMHKISRDENCIVLNVTHSLSHLDLYDSIVVLHEGHIAYHGPTRYLIHYFDVARPEEVFPRLARKSPGSWHRSWVKHRAAYDAPANAELEAAAARHEKVLAAARAANPVVALERVGDTGDLPEHPPSSGLADPCAPAQSYEAACSPLREDRDRPPHHRPPGAVSQFFTLLGRRWKIFRRDKGQFWIHAALVFGFPCLVVIFALEGLPAIQNLDAAPGANPLQQLVEANRYLVQSTSVGSLVSGLVMFQVILLTLMGANNGAREIASERLVFEKETLGGLRPISYVLSKAAFLFVLVAVQSAWMALFVKLICRFPGDLFQQAGLLFMVNAAMTSVCLGISSLMRSAEQASLVSVYLVGFQLPLSGAVLALPEFLGAASRPFIAAYWSWSGLLQTMKDTRFYEAVQTVTQTGLSPVEVCFWVLGCHVILGLFLAWMGCKHSRWE